MQKCLSDSLFRDNPLCRASEEMSYFQNVLSLNTLVRLERSSYVPVSFSFSLGFFFLGRFLSKLIIFWAVTYLKWKIETPGIRCLRYCVFAFQARMHFWKGSFKTCLTGLIRSLHSLQWISGAEITVLGKILLLPDVPSVNAFMLG